MKKIICILVIGALAIAGCKKLYDPKVISTSKSYLVIEGFISTGTLPTTITLTRTTPLTADTVRPEIGAKVMIEGDNSTSYPVTEAGDGKYISGALSLDAARKYRLRVTTTDGLVYLSDFAEAKISPPIDSVGFTANPDRMDIYASTHDPANNTRYYRWDYEETWRFHARYESLWETNGVGTTVGTDIVPRKDSIYYCFANDVSHNVLINSSAKLTQDVIYQDPIVSIPSTSEKLELRYSILVKQYALTKEAYQFWDDLKKNTEDLGSIFDVQPSQLTGNIKCISDPSVPVIGYMSVGSISTKRIFIDHAQVPNYNYTYPYQCGLDTAFYFNPNTMVFEVQLTLLLRPDLYVPVVEFRNADKTKILGYLWSTPFCADCTIRGKVATPSFWK